MPRIDKGSRQFMPKLGNKPKIKSIGPGATSAAASTQTQASVLASTPPTSTPTPTPISTVVSPPLGSGSGSKEGSGTLTHGVTGSGAQEGHGQGRGRGEGEGESSGSQSLSGAAADRAQVQSQSQAPSQTERLPMETLTTHSHAQGQTPPQSQSQSQTQRQTIPQPPSSPPTLARTSASTLAPAPPPGRVPTRFPKVHHSRPDQQEGGGGGRGGSSSAEVADGVAVSSLGSAEGVVDTVGMRDDGAGGERDLEERGQERGQGEERDRVDRGQDGVAERSQQVAVGSSGSNETNYPSPAQPPPPPASRPHTTLLAPMTIPASRFPHRMTDEQLLPTPGFVLPSLEEMRPRPKPGGRREAFMGRRAKRKGEEQVGDGVPGSGSGRGVGQVEVVIDVPSRVDHDGSNEGSEISGDDYEPEGKSRNSRRKRAETKRKGKKRQVQGEADVEDGDAGDQEALERKRKRPGKKTGTTQTGGAIDPVLLGASGNGDGVDDPAGAQDEGTTDDDTDDDESTTTSPHRRRRRRRQSKRLRVSIKDDLDEDQLATLRPGQAIGSDIDETILIMADLAAGPGRGRISGKAIKLQQNRKEIERRKEEQEERRLKIRTEREMRMRGIRVGFAGEVERVEGEGEEKGRRVGKGGDDEAREEEEEEEDIEADDVNGVVGQPRVDPMADDDDPLRPVGDADAADDDDEEDEDDHQYAMTANPMALSYDDEGNLIFNNVIDRQQLLQEAMQSGTVFEDNDDLKFTNSMSHSKRASTIRWTKEMREKLLTLLRQHGQVYETIAKIMALYYPQVERTHVANHLRGMNQKDPDTLTWALARENKLDIDMNELKRVFPGIDFDSPLPDITMYFNPDIDPAELRTLKRKKSTSASSKPMTEQEKKKNARRQALSRKRQEKARQRLTMGTEEVGEVMEEEAIAAVRRLAQPGA